MVRCVCAGQFCLFTAYIYLILKERESAVAFFVDDTYTFYTEIEGNYFVCFYT